MHDGLSTQPTGPPATKPPHYMSQQQIMCTSSKVTRVNLGFLLIVLHSLASLTANLTQQNGNLQLRVLTFSLA